MILSPGGRKAALTVHIASSAGWLGAVGVFLVLALVGVTSRDAQTVRGAYLVMDAAAKYTLVPLALATLVTGAIQSLGTPWGLLRHYWVIIKLGITAVWTIVLLAYLQTFAAMAQVAGAPRADLAAVANPSPVLHAGAALAGLLVALGLSVFKPRGMTRHGQRKQQRRGRERPRTEHPVPSQP